MRLLKEKAAVMIGSSDLEIAAAEAVRFMHLRRLWTVKLIEMLWQFNWTGHCGRIARANTNTPGDQIASPADVVQYRCIDGREECNINTT
jgi:hypothetical protein